jgi:hypothetical protein
MFIALASVSKDPAITRPLLDNIAVALETQLYQHYAPFWQSAGMNVRVLEADDPVMKQQDCSPLIVYDKADEPGALGYHSLQARAQVYGKAFWDVIRKSGGTLTSGANSLSVTLSHEALEMAGNPYVNFWADVVDDTTQEAIELCDRVEADAYTIEGIDVSNFLGPRAFRKGPGPYDWMGLLDNPFDLRPGGYAIRRNGDNVFNVWGRSYPEHRKALKTAADSRLARRQALITLKGDS